MPDLTEPLGHERAPMLGPNACSEDNCIFGNQATSNPREKSAMAITGHFEKAFLQKSLRHKHAREDSNLQPLVPKTSALSN